MTGETIASVAILGLVAILPVLALRRRGIGLENGLKMVAAWLAIFIVVMVAFTWLQS